jgi:hypothetical protein
MTTDHDEVCKEISGELEDTARWLAGGQLSPEQYRRAVTRMEHCKHERFGFKLSSFVSDGGLVHFSLRLADTDELCASMDVNPWTGEIAVQSACR